MLSNTLRDMVFLFVFDTVEAGCAGLSYPILIWPRSVQRHNTNPPFDSSHKFSRSTIKKTVYLSHFVAGQSTDGERSIYMF